ncbi:MAG: PorP/SprF family type IX secretion system membrane protein [Bacteroidota bacterium]
MKNLIIILFSVCLLLAQVFRTPSFAQDAHFSQFYTAPLLLNPGATGAFFGNIRAGLNFRNQWNSIGSPFQTYSASIEKVLLKEQEKGKYLGVGLQMFTDRAGYGALKRTKFDVSISYNAKLNEKNNLALGLQGGFAQRGIDYTQLTWDNQYDGIQFVGGLSSGETLNSNVYYIDLSSGMLWNYRINDKAGVSAGVGLFHLNKPEQSLLANSEGEKLDFKMIIHGEGRYVKNDKTIIYPNLLFIQQGSMYQINAGAIVKKLVKEGSKYTGYIKGNAICFGGYFRFNDAIIIVTAFEIEDWKLGLSYDVNISPLSKATTGRGGFEISIVYRPIPD